MGTDHLEHLRYEVEAFLQTSYLLADLEERRLEVRCAEGTLADRSTAPDYVRRALLEASLVHARVLIEFLVGRPSRSGPRWDRIDIKPEDLLGRPWSPSDDSAVGRLHETLDRIDKHLAHLSLKRVGADEVWTEEHVVALRGMLGDFWDALAREGVRAERWRKILAVPHRPFRLHTTTN